MILLTSLALILLTRLGLILLTRRFTIKYRHLNHMRIHRTWYDSQIQLNITHNSGEWLLMMYKQHSLLAREKFSSLLGISYHTKLILEVSQLRHWQWIFHKFAICSSIYMYWNFILHDHEFDEVKIHLNVFYHNTHRVFPKAWLLTPNNCRLKSFTLVASFPSYTTPQHVVLSTKHIIFYCTCLCQKLLLRLG